MRASTRRRATLASTFTCPFCSVRCGYCDFNTYAPGEVEGATREGYVEAALAEMAFARGVMGERPAPGVDRLLWRRHAHDARRGGALVRLLDGVRETWGIVPGAEVTTEANPDSVTRESLAALASAGFTRVSASACSPPCRTCSRPWSAPTIRRTSNARSEWAREAGLAVSLDLIYGTPGESLDDWRTSLDAAIALAPGPHQRVLARDRARHPHGRPAAQRARSPPPTRTPRPTCTRRPTTRSRPRATAWYEVSNWARTPADACRHNIAYWRSQDWWGIGPGAHSLPWPARRRAKSAPPSGGGTSSTRAPTRAGSAAGESPAAETEPLTPTTSRSSL